MQYNNNKTPFSAYSNQNNKKILDAIDELQEEVDTISSSLDGVSSSLSSKADAQTTASSIQEINTNVSNLSNALTSLRDDIKSGDIGKIDDIEVDNISVNDEIKAKRYQWKEGEELSINKVLVPKNGSIYFVYSGIKTALIQYNASNNFIVLSSSNGFVKYGNYNNEIAFTVSESSYINYIGDISITTGNITNEVLTKAGTTVVGSLYASLQEANINNLTVANLSAEVIAGDEVRADNITADYVTVDEITADVGNIEDLESDAARIKELNTSQINTKVDIENIGYTIIPEHQSGTDYLVVVPETNGTWNLELPGYFKATIIKTKDAAVITYNRTSVVALSKIEVKYGRLYLFTEGYGKLYFANDSLENDNTVATYTETPPYTEPDETLELTSNNGTVNTTRAYFNNVTIYGSMSIRDYSADKINTSKNDTDDTFYPTFVDSNNENEDAEKLYTSTNLSLNPYEGKVTTCIVCAADCVETPLVNADLVCADICSDVINTTSLNSTTITNTGNVGTCDINVTCCATIKDLNVAEQTETGSLVVNNDAFIKGDLWVDGTTHTVDEETVTTQSDTIVLRANNNTSLGDNLSGIVINKYNGTDDLGIVTDADGTLRVGTGTGTTTSYPAISYNSTTNKWYTDPTDLTTEVTPLGNLTSWATKTEDGPYTNYTNAVFTVFDKTSLEPVMTRDESTDMTDGQIVCWDSTGNKAKTTNCISDNVTFAKCVDVECNLTVDNSICACCNVDTPTVNADNVNICCCLTACNATFTDSVTVCNDFRVCGSAIIHGLTSDCMAVQENTSNHNMYPTFVCRNNAQQQGELMFTDYDLNYNPFTNTLYSPNIEFTNAHGNNVTADLSVTTLQATVNRIMSPDRAGFDTSVEFYQHQNNDTYRKIACLECNTFKYEPLSGDDCCGKMQFMLSDNTTFVDQCNYVQGGFLHTCAVIATDDFSEFCGICTKYDLEMYKDVWNCQTGIIYCDGSACWARDWRFCENICVERCTYMNGPLIISAVNGASNHDEGIRINAGLNGYADMTIGTTGACGIATGFWIGTNCCSNENKLFVNYHCSSVGSYFQGNSDGTTTWVGNVSGTATYSHKARILDAGVIDLGGWGDCNSAVWGGSTGDSYGICTNDWRNYISVAHGNYNTYYGLSFAMPFWENQRFAWRVRNNGNLCPIHELIDDRGGQTINGRLTANDQFVATGANIGSYDWSEAWCTAGVRVWNGNVDNSLGAAYVPALVQLAPGGGSFSLGILSGDARWGITYNGGPFISCIDGNGNVWNSGFVQADIFCAVRSSGLVACSSLGGEVWLGQSSIAIGNGVSWSDSSNSVTAIGYNASARWSYSTAVGGCARAHGDYATALGWDSFANNHESIAIGHDANAYNVCSIAIGTGACTCSSQSIAIGPSSCATSCCSISIGHGANAASPGNASIGAWTGSYNYYGWTFNAYHRLGSRTWKMHMVKSTNALNCDLRRGLQQFLESNVAGRLDTITGTNHTYRFFGTAFDNVNDNYDDPYTNFIQGMVCGQSISCPLKVWHRGDWGTICCTDTGIWNWGSCTAMFDVTMTVVG